MGTVAQEAPQSDSSGDANNVVEPGVAHSPIETFDKLRKNYATYLTSVL